MIAARMKEFLAMLMIGDGLLAALEPRQHALVWRAGPPAWQAMIDPFVENPRLTRWLGVAGVLAGIWLARRQVPTWEGQSVQPCHGQERPEHPMERQTA